MEQETRWRIVDPHTDDIVALGILSEQHARETLHYAELDAGYKLRLEPYVAYKHWPRCSDGGEPDCND